MTPWLYIDFAEALGYAAYTNGRYRESVRQIFPQDGPLAVAWLRGWDEAKADALSAAQR